MTEKQLQVRLLGAGVWLVLFALLAFALLDKGDSFTSEDHLAFDGDIDSDVITEPIPLPNIEPEAQESTEVVRPHKTMDQPPLNTPSKSKEVTKAVKKKQQVKRVSNVAHFPPTGWYVQLASFRNKRKAVKLSEKLQQAGHDSLVKSSKKGTLHRVRIGPFKTKQTASQTQKKFNRQYGKKFGITNKGMVIKQP